MGSKDAAEQSIMQAIKNQKQPPSLYETEVVGTCSRCQGPVAVPKFFYSGMHPVPTCQKCGATKKQPFGPVIDME